MEREIRRININKDLWIFIQGNKISFGGSFLNKGLHATISFGNTSGLLDLHLTRDDPKRHYSIITVSHQDFLILITHFSDNITQYLPSQTSKLNATSLILPLSGTEHTSEQIIDGSLNSNLSNFYNSKTGKKLKIDENSSEFKNMVTLLGNDFKHIWMNNLLSIDEFETEGNCTGLLIGNEQVSIIVRRNGENYLINNFGKSFFVKVLLRIFGSKVLKFLSVKFLRGQVKLLNIDKFSHEAKPIQIKLEVR